jgi:hypothetical protein
MRAKIRAFAGCGKTPLSTEKLMFCNRARLQSCRNYNQIDVGFSPCGLLSANLTQPRVFFRSLFRPGAVRSAANAAACSTNSRRKCSGSLNHMPSAFSVLLLAVLLGLGSTAWAEQAERIPAELPEAPQLQTALPAAAPCPAATSAQATAAVPGKAAGTGNVPAGPETAPAPCTPRPPANYWFSRFLNGPEVKPLTPKEKARLAMRNVLDPFNGLTILADAGIAVGSDAHSAYGPGMTGFGRYVGVSFTQDLTGEFLCTFLIPSVVHQDPHYHRMPNASIPRRVRHAITQVLWTQGDNGRGMVNYADLVGAAASDEINNLYVPGRETNMPASAARWGIGLATAPIDNFVS